MKSPTRTDPIQPDARTAASSPGPDRERAGADPPSAAQPASPPSVGCPGDQAERLPKFVGLGSHLSRERKHPRGSVTRFGKRPEVWRGLYYVYVSENGVQKRVQRRPVIGRTASMNKRAAEDELARMIERELARPSPRIRNPTFSDVWESFRSVKSGVWSKATAGNLQSIFEKHVLPTVGDRDVGQLTPDPLQRLLNQVAQRGYRKSILKHIRTYVRAALEYAVDEGLIHRNPGRKLELPRTEKSRERFYTLTEINQLLSVSAGRENLVIRILLFCGLRPAELLALRIEDVAGNQLRIDEAVKEKETGARRIGDTKTETSDAWVSVPPELARDLEAWVAQHPDRQDAKAFLFPTRAGSAYRVGNFLKRVMKPIARAAGIEDFDFRAMRATASTLFQRHGSVKDTQAQMRHADPTTTLRYYVKVIPEAQHEAVAEFEDAVMKRRW